jgi:hypothetical protein
MRHTVSPDWYFVLWLVDSHKSISARDMPGLEADDGHSWSAVHLMNFGLEH